MRFTLLAAASAALVTSVTAQASTTVSQSMPPTATAGFNIGLITQQQRFQWCLAQTNNCPLICGGTTLTNTCLQSELTYSCICSNGTVPDVTAYQDTLPFYLCQATYKQCIDANPDDAQGQDTCMRNQQCGTLNATEVENTSGDSTSPSSTSATTVETAASTSSPSGSAASAIPTNAAVIPTQPLGTGTFAAILLVAFKLLL